MLLRAKKGGEATSPEDLEMIALEIEDDAVRASKGLVGAHASSHWKRGASQGRGRLIMHAAACMRIARVRRTRPRLQACLCCSAGSACTYGTMHRGIMHAAA